MLPTCTVPSPNSTRCAVPHAAACQRCSRKRCCPWRLYMITCCVRCLPNAPCRWSPRPRLLLSDSPARPRLPLLIPPTCLACPPSSPPVPIAPVRVAVMPAPSDLRSHTRALSWPVSSPHTPHRALPPLFPSRPVSVSCRPVVSALPLCCRRQLGSLPMPPLRYSLQWGPCPGTYAALACHPTPLFCPPPCTRPFCTWIAAAHAHVAWVVACACCLRLQRLLLIRSM